MTADFDRLRPRVIKTAGQPGPPSVPTSHDAEGKRALYSSAAETSSPGVGSAIVECSRCSERTVLGPGQAVRAALPSLHLGVRVGRGNDVHTFALGGRDYPTYMRCPACGRPSWVRFTVQV